MNKKGSRIKQRLDRIPWTGVFWGNILGLLVVGLGLHSWDSDVQKWMIKLRQVMFFPLSCKILGRIIKEAYLYGVIVWILLPFYCGFWGGLIEWLIKKILKK